MQKRYGDALRKDAGLTKVIKLVATKNARLLESRAGKHVPQLGRVAKEVKGSFDKVFKETEEVVEEFLHKCSLLRSSLISGMYVECDTSSTFQRGRNCQESCRIRKCCSSSPERSSSSRQYSSTV